MTRDEFKGLRGQSYEGKPVRMPDQEPVSSVLAATLAALVVIALMLSVRGCTKAYGADRVGSQGASPGGSALAQADGASQQTKEAADEAARRAWKRELGRMLFHDRRVGDGTTSCADCHRIDHGFSDGRKLAVGRIGSRGFPEGRVGKRHTQTALNTGFLGDKPKFWDGRAENLADQAVGPISNPDEMATQTPDEMCARLNRIAGYRTLCRNAFGEDRLTPQRFAVAIAQFEADVLVAVDTPATRYFNGDSGALGEAATRGAQLFKANCAVCHPAPLYTTGLAANTGVELLAPTNDLGLETTTRESQHRHAFATPGLVHVHAQAPYCHNGAIPTLARMVAHYGAGGSYIGPGGKSFRDKRIDPRVARIRLDAQQQADLVVFLTEGLVAYDYPRPEQVIPRELPR